MRLVKARRPIYAVPNPAALLYAPPPQSNPTVLNVSSESDSYNGSETTDYIVNIGARTRGFSFFGGQNVRIIGGSVIPTDDNVSGLLAVRGASQSVFIEGILFDNSANTYELDAIDVTGDNTYTNTVTGITGSPVENDYTLSVNSVSGLTVGLACAGSGILSGSHIQTINGSGLTITLTRAATGSYTNTPLSFYPSYTPNIYIQNCRAQGMHGHLSGVHSDGIQTQGVIGNLFVDKFTVYTNYQGLFLSPQFGWKSLNLHRINVVYRAMAGVENDADTYLVAFHDLATGIDYYPYEPFNPIYLDRVWGWPLRNEGIAQKHVQPSTDWDPSDISAIPSGGGAAWQSGLNCVGRIQYGLPPGGDFVRALQVGANYQSPGYLRSAPVAV